MGNSIEGILAYGFDLGGAGTWHLQGVREYDPWRPSWIYPGDQAGVDDETYDYQSKMTERLAAHDLDSLEVVTYGDLTVEDGMGYILAAWSMQTRGASTASPHLADVQARRLIERWDDQLMQALKVLDIRPWQPQPLTILSQSYG